MVLKEDLESLADPSNHPEDILKAVFYHPKDPEVGVDYQQLFMHLGACKFCRRVVYDERERNPIYPGYVQAVEEGKVKEYWDEIKRIQIEIIGEKFNHKG